LTNPRTAEVKVWFINFREIYVVGKQQIAGTKFGNIHYYCELIKVTAVGNTWNEKNIGYTTEVGKPTLCFV